MEIVTDWIVGLQEIIYNVLAHASFIDNFWRRLATIVLARKFMRNKRRRKEKSFVPQIKMYNSGNCATFVDVRASTPQLTRQKENERTVYARMRYKRVWGISYGIIWLYSGGHWVAFEICIPSSRRMHVSHYTGDTPLAKVCNGGLLDLRANPAESVLRAH